MTIHVDVGSFLVGMVAGVLVLLFMVALLYMVERQQ